MSHEKMIDERWTKQMNFVVSNTRSNKGTSSLIFPFSFVTTERM